MLATDLILFFKTTYKDRIKSQRAGVFISKLRSFYFAKVSLFFFWNWIACVWLLSCLRKNKKVIPVFEKSTRMWAKLFRRIKFFFHIFLENKNQKAPIKFFTSFRVKRWVLFFNGALVHLKKKPEVLLFGVSGAFLKSFDLFYSGVLSVGFFNNNSEYAHFYNIVFFFQLCGPDGGIFFQNFNFFRKIINTTIAAV